MRQVVLVFCILASILCNIEMGLDKLFRGMNVIYQCMIPGMVALTYDDGVSMYTEELLNVLDEEKIHVTFFVVGYQLAANKTRAYTMLSRMWNAGHVVGSHTYNHANLTALSDASVVDEMKRTEALIGEAIGVCPLLMRPPFGEINNRTESVLESLGYKVVIWNVDSDDWRLQANPPLNITMHVEGMFPNRPSDPSKSYIILDHDTLHPSVLAQREIIRNLKAKGYIFGNMSECLGGIPAYRPF